MPATKEQYISKDECKDCRSGSRWWMRTMTTLMGLVLIIVGWSLWSSYDDKASAAIIRREQTAQGKDNEWIKASLERIEKRMDGLRLAGGE